MGTHGPCGCPVPKKECFFVRGGLAYVPFIIRVRILEELCSEGEIMRFAAEYIENVLSENFEDFKKFFFSALMDIHYAHLVMLNETNIINSNDARELVSGLDQIKPDKLENLIFDGTYEDFFYYIETLLEKSCGAEIAGKLHTARSRNDIDVTLYRLRWRTDLVKLQEAVVDLRRTLLDVAYRERETIFPMYTHTQAAQPSTLAHYFLGILEHLERDSNRLKAALEVMNQSPLGSCAITGTSFPIDRKLTSRLLEFDSPTGNTHGSIASTDYVLQVISAVLILVTNSTRWVQDLLLWSTTEFRYVRLSDRFVQPSSIMPQKRNPVALEHSRAILSRCMGQSTAVFQMIHNTPFGDIVDIEDDLQPLVYRAFRDSIGPMKLLCGVLKEAEFDRRRLASKAAEGQITMTELADSLVRRENVSFRHAHAITTRLVQAAAEEDVSLSDGLLQAGREVCNKEILYSEAEILEILRPENFVRSRKNLGGPAPERVLKAIEEIREKIERDAEWTESLSRRFRDFGNALRNRARDI